MSKKHHGGPAPVPPENRPQAGPAFTPADDDTGSAGAGDESGAGFQNQDPQRRLGNFSGGGEHPRQQPGRLNDGDTHSR